MSKKQTSLERIKELAVKSGQIRGAKIEYNFKELPKEVTRIDFFGVPAVFNKDLKEETAGIIYQLN